MKKAISIILTFILMFSMCVSVSATQGSENAAITYRQIKVVLDGKEITPCDETGNTVEPFIMNSNGSTYLPLRAIGQALGLNVSWDSATNTVSLTSDGVTKTGTGASGTTTGTHNVTITYRDITVVFDGKRIELVNTKGETVEPFIMDGTTYLPLRVIGEALDIEVSWDSATNTVFLETAENDEIVNQEAYIECASEFNISKYTFNTFTIFMGAGNYTEDYFITYKIADTNIALAKWLDGNTFDGKSIDISIAGCKEGKTTITFTLHTAGGKVFAEKTVNITVV